MFCFCFILLRLFFCVSFRLWSISFITCLHDSQTTYTPSSGHKHVKQYRRTTLASKGNKQKRCDLSSRRVRLCQHKGGGTFPGIHPRPCERGLRIDIRYVWTPQNGSFRKRIFFKTYTCARSLRTCRSASGNTERPFQAQSVLHRTDETSLESKRTQRDFPRRLFLYTVPSAAERTAPNGVKERASFCLVFRSLNTTSSHRMFSMD